MCKKAVICWLGHTKSCVNNLCFKKKSSSTKDFWLEFWNKKGIIEIISHERRVYKPVDDGRLSKIMSQKRRKIAVVLVIKLNFNWTTFIVQTFIHKIKIWEIFMFYILY